MASTAKTLDIQPSEASKVSFKRVELTVSPDPRWRNEAMPTCSDGDFVFTATAILFIEAAGEESAL